MVKASRPGGSGHPPNLDHERSDGNAAPMTPAVTDAIREHYAALCHASQQLAAAGYSILAIGAETQFGILPIVASITEAGTLTLVFADVRVTNAHHNPPIGARDHARSRQLRRLSAAYINAHHAQPHVGALRWDALGVTTEPGGGFSKFEHVRGAL